MKLLLDTHALLWWQARHRKLSRTATREIRRAEALLVSAITCWEVATLVEQGRVRLDRTVDEWLADMEREPRVELVPLSPRAAAHALALARSGFHGDPADRLLYATAAELMVPFCTADTRIHDYAGGRGVPVRIVW